MSYVLDALKKADIERRAGVFPSLAPAPSGRPAALQPPGRIGVGIAAGVGMLLAGFALGAWRPWQTVPAKAKETVVAAPTTVQVAAVVPPLPQSAVAASKPTPAPAKPETPAATGAEQDRRLPAPARRPAPSAGEGGQSAAAAKLLKAAQTQALPGIPKAPGARVLAYRDLPSDVQRSVPRISFGGYAGMGEADERVAFINDRLIREGEEVSPGVKLERVGEEGAVLSYEGYRFRP